MTYAQPFGPGVSTGSDVTSSPGGGASPYASDTSDVTDTDASPHYDVARPYSHDRAEVPLRTDANLPYGLRAGSETDQLPDPDDADQAYYGHDGSYQGAGYDTDGDGRVDTMMLDENGDGRVDAYAYDRDGDGHFELVSRDTNLDGRIDTLAIDYNDNGVPDKIVFDTDYDGQYDAVRYPDPETDPFDH